MVKFHIYFKGIFVKSYSCPLPQFKLKGSEVGTIRGGACSPEEKVSSGQALAGRGRRERRILPFFSFCRGSRSTYISVAYACREVDVTLAICFCVLSALILTFKRPLKVTEPLLTPSYVL